MVARIGHVALRVSDLARSVAFAQQILGLREVERVDGTSYLTCNERHHELQLIEAAEAGCDHAALEVSGVDAIETLRERIVAAGCPILSEQPQEHGIEHGLRFVSPFGLQIELFAGMELGQPSRYDTIGVRPRKFGHFTLKTDDPGGVEEFFVRVLGFRLSDRMSDTLTWMRCNSDHHGVGLAKGQGNSLHHYAFELESWASIEQTGDHLQGHDQILIYGPGRHGPGKNLFSYFVDPEGGLVEFFADIQRVEDDARHEALDWPDVGQTINQWGPLPPPDFLDYGTPYLAPAVLA